MESNIPEQKKSAVVKTTNPDYIKEIESLNPREKEFFIMLCYCMGDEELALGYCGTFETIAEEFQDKRTIAQLEDDDETTSILREINDSNLLNPDVQEQLAAHKTRQPVINELNSNIDFVTPTPDAYDSGKLPDTIQDEHAMWPKLVINEVDLMPHSAMEPVLKQIEQVFNYCKEQGITPDQLIERYTAYTLKETLPQAWTFEILAYCSSLGISTDELIEQHRVAYKDL